MARRRAARRRRAAPHRSTVVENFTFTVESGTISNVLVRVLGNRPPRSNFRPLWFEVEACAYIPGSGDPTFSPVAMQLTMSSEDDGSYVATSPLKLVNNLPVRLRVQQPRSSDWWAYNTKSDTVVCSVHAVCAGKPPTENKVFLRGIGRVGLLVQEEVTVATCPAVELDTLVMM